MGAGGLAPINAYGTPPQLADWRKDALVNRVLYQCRAMLHLGLRSVAACRYLRLRIVPLQPRQHLVQLRIRQSQLLLVSLPLPQLGSRRTFTDGFGYVKGNCEQLHLTFIQVSERQQV